MSSTIVNPADTVDAKLAGLFTNVITLLPTPDEDNPEMEIIRNNTNEMLEPANIATLANGIRESNDLETDESKLPNIKLSDMFKAIIDISGLSTLMTQTRDLFTDDSFSDEVNSVLSGMMGGFKGSTRSLFVYSVLPVYMAENNIPKVEQLLESGLDPNIKVRKNKRLEHFAGTPEMLDVLVKYGLIISANSLNYVPMPVFRHIIRQYNIDPFENTEPFTGRHWMDKIQYLNRVIKKRRMGWNQQLSGIILPSDLSGLLIDYLVPRFLSSV